MSEKVNGWTISQRDGLWQAVYRGIVGKSHSLESVIRTFAKTTRLPDPVKRK